MNRDRPLLCFVMALFAVLFLPRANAAASEDWTGVEEIIREAMEAQQIPGVAVGVSRAGKLVYAHGFGYADLEHEVGVTEHTVFRIGSITKQFTAAAAMALVEDGKLDLESDLTDHFPDYPVKEHRISIKRLLNHTSGIKGYTEMESFWSQARLDLTHEEMIELFSSEPFEFEPGARYQYNNSAYFLLGVLIERLSGVPYSTFVRERLLDPNGLSETYYLDEKRLIDNRAEGYELDDGEVVNDDFLSMDLPYAAGSMGSTVVDLLKWQDALTSGRVVSEESYSKMISPGTLIDGERLQYGYGLAIGSLEGHPKVSHGGGINGFITQLALYPEDDLGVAVLCNLGSANTPAILSRLSRHLLGLEQIVIEEVPLSMEALSRLAGTYDSGRAPLRILVEERRLTVQGMTLIPVGPLEFRAQEDPERRFRFTESGGEVSAVHTEREGQTSEAKRVRD